MPYTILEPHPTVQANAYTHSGRGGLGNIFRAPTSVTPAAGIPTPLSLSCSSPSPVSRSSSSTRFYAGRGGAGNVYPISERQSVSLDDEFAHASTVAKSAMRGHVGRGGAGNYVPAPSTPASTPRNASTYPSSSSSGQSTADKIAQSIRLGWQGSSKSASHVDFASKPRKGSDASFMSDASSESDAATSARRSSLRDRMFFRDGASR
ncbi:hypothetical protein SEPCBS119000_004208 [Sporothrix epigloea]|uniref:Uncharacterized protein n=1 Tax=Sporothrix epigloea TaxID=1892477 RepID=A0ABP0DQV7_9PEZI